MKDDQSSTRNDLPDVEECPPPPEPTAVCDVHPFDTTAARYEAAYNAFKTLLQDQATAIARYNSEWPEIGGEIDIDHEKAIHTYGNLIIDALIDEASTAFGVRGQSIPIDRLDIRELFWPHVPYDERDDETSVARRTREQFSPVAIWAYLKRTYRGQGRTLALEAAAKALVHWLPFDGTGVIARNEKAVTFSTWINTSTPSRFVSARSFELAVHNRADGPINRAFRAFAVFFEETPDLGVPKHQLSQDLARIGDFFFQERGCFDSRFKLSIGPITLMFFKSKIDVIVPLIVAEKLNLFLSEYASEALQRAIRGSR